MSEQKRYPNLRPPWPKGTSGNPSGRPKRPTVKALDDLIKKHGGDEGLAELWLREALGSNFGFFKLLIEYRNGKVPDHVVHHDESEEGEGKPYEIPELDERYRPKKRKRGDKAKEKTSAGDVPEGTPDLGSGGDG